jgi:hypothetical protein
LCKKGPKNEQPQQPSENSQPPLTMKVLINGGMWLIWFGCYSAGEYLTASLDPDNKNPNLSYLIIPTCIACGSMLGSGLSHTISKKIAPQAQLTDYRKLMIENLIPDLAFFGSDLLSNDNELINASFNALCCGLASTVVLTVTARQLSLVHFTTGMSVVGLSAAFYTGAEHLSPTPLITALAIFGSTAAVPLINTLAAWFIGLVGQLLKSPINTVRHSV